jgi:hypothetical protein
MGNGHPAVEGQAQGRGRAVQNGSNELDLLNELNSSKPL